MHRPFCRHRRIRNLFHFLRRPDHRLAVVCTSPMTSRLIHNYPSCGRSRCDNIKTAPPGLELDVLLQASVNLIPPPDTVSRFRICQITGILKLQAGCADNLQMSSISNALNSVNVSGAQGSGLAAIATGSRRLTQDAQQIANPDNPKVTNSLMDLNQSLLLAEAGANVISTSNKMLGTLLDVLA